MAGTSLGTAWIQIKPTTSGITKEVKKELANVEKEMTGSGSKISSAFSSLGSKAGTALKVGLTAAAAGATAGAISLIKNAVSSFADYEQLVGGVDTLFKNASEQVQSYASQAFETAQISANDYMETVTSFSASLIQSLGGDTTKAAEYANNAIIDMADNANKMGTSMEMIQSAYQGFAKQNYTMLDNLKLGYGGTKTEMERLLKDAEALSGIHYEIGNFADMTAAIYVVQENLGIAGTSAKEASETVSGSLNAMKSAWANLIVGMGDKNADMKALMKNFVKTAETALKNLIPVLLESLNGIGELITQLTPIIVEKLPELIQTLIPQFINVVIQLANAIIQNLPLILTTILQGFVQALPTFIQAVVQTLPTLIIAIVDFLTNPDNIGLLVDAAIQLFMGLVMAVPQILGGLMEAFGKLVGNLWDGLTRMFGEFAGNFGNFIGGIFKGAINGVISFIEGFINLPIDTLNGFIGIINGAFGWIGVNLGYIDRIHLPRLAKGGVVEGVGTDTSDSNLYALSKGEYVIRASAAREIGYENLNRMNETGEISGGGQTNYFTINGYNKSPEELATIISRKIAFNQRGVLG